MSKWRRNKKKKICEMLTNNDKNKSRTKPKMCNIISIFCECVCALCETYINALDTLREMISFKKSSCDECCIEFIDFSRKTTQIFCYWFFFEGKIKTTILFTSKFTETKQINTQIKHLYWLEWYIKCH